MYSIVPLPLDPTYDQTAFPHLIAPFGLYFSLCRRAADGKWHQNQYPLGRLPSLVASKQGKVDWYISQAYFRSSGNRLAANVAAFTHCWVDLDTYKVESLLGLNDRQIIGKICEICDSELLPPPTSIIKSGGGYYVKWSFSTLLIGSASAKLVSVNKELINRFSDLGADPRSADAARVLRIPGTIHRETGRIVEQIWTAPRPENRPPLYDFGELADAILPAPPAQIEVSRLIVRRPPALVEAPPNRKSTKRRFPIRQWSELVLADLLRLAEMRGGKIAEGLRDEFSFIAACHFSFLVPPEEIYEATAQFISPFVDSVWTQKYLSGYLGSTIRRAELAFSGETVEFDGVLVDPRYRLKRSSIIERLDIQAAEQAHLRCIISNLEKVIRRNARKRTSPPKTRGRPVLNEKAQFFALLAADPSLNISSLAKKMKIDRRTLTRWKTEVRQGHEINARQAG